MQGLYTNATLETFLLIKTFWNHFWLADNLFFFFFCGVFWTIYVKLSTHQGALEGTLQTADCNLQRMKERIQAAVKFNPATAIATCFPAPLLNSERWPLTLSGSSNLAWVIDRKHLASFWSSYDYLSLSYLSSVSPLGRQKEKGGGGSTDWGPYLLTAEMSARH